MSATSKTLSRHQGYVALAGHGGWHTVSVDAVAAKAEGGLALPPPHPHHVQPAGAERGQQQGSALGRS